MYAIPTWMLMLLVYVEGFHSYSKSNHPCRLLCFTVPSLDKGVWSDHKHWLLPIGTSQLCSDSFHKGRSSPPPWHDHVIQHPISPSEPRLLTGATVKHSDPASYLSRTAGVTILHTFFLINKNRIWFFCHGFPALSLLPASPPHPLCSSLPFPIQIHIYGPFSQEPVQTFTRFKDTPYCRRYRSDGQMLVAGCEDSVVRLFDVSGRVALRMFKGHSK